MDSILCMAFSYITVLVFIFCRHPAFIYQACVPNRFDRLIVESCATLSFLDFLIISVILNIDGWRGEVLKSCLAYGGRIMTIYLIIIALLAAAYLFAAVTFYFGFKNWYPLCGRKSSICKRGESCPNSLSQKQAA